MITTIPLGELRLATHLRRGDVVAWPQGPGEPLALTEALMAQAAELDAPELLFGLTASPTLRSPAVSRFRLHALNGVGHREVMTQAEVLPYAVSALPALFRQRLLRVDVMLIQVRPLPDGAFTLGVIADFTQAMIASARIVIALLNPALPAVAGDARVEPADIDLLVEADDRLIDMPDPEPSDAEREVARHVAALVPDRATVELGVGTLPAAVAAALHGHRGLGVHTGVISDVLVDLVERGIVTNEYKGLDDGVTVTGGLFGTRRLRDFAEQGGAVAMRSADHTHQIPVMARLQRFHTINSAIEIDLTGQVNSEIAGGRYLGAVGGLGDFVRGGVASPGGRSILALPSTTPDGKRSRIVASLGANPVSVARSDIDVVVTEFGAAHLRGVSLRERARRLEAIAHPDHREALQRAVHDAAVRPN